MNNQRVRTEVFNGGIIIPATKRFVKCQTCDAELTSNEIVLVPVTVMREDGSLDTDRISYIPVCLECMDKWFENGGTYEEECDCQDQD